ncbi:unnamed protein product [Colias eurytheme]|nr:unnamed protein product [Colias eurytheme]
MRAGGARARLQDYGAAAISVIAEKVLRRRLRGVCQIAVFTVQKSIVFSGQIVRCIGDNTDNNVEAPSPLCHLAAGNRFLFELRLLKFYAEVAIV